MTKVPPLSTSLITIDLSSNKSFMASLWFWFTFYLQFLFVWLIGVISNMSKLCINFSSAWFPFIRRYVVTFISDQMSLSSLASKYSKSLIFLINSAKSSFSFWLFVLCGAGVYFNPFSGTHFSIWSSCQDRFTTLMGILWTSALLVGCLHCATYGWLLFRRCPKIILICILAVVSLSGCLIIPLTGIILQLG